MRTLLASLASVLLITASSASAQIVLDADVPDDGSAFLLVPFAVPDGTVEIEIRHDDLSDANILDWGVLDPSGESRGWGGGNPEPAIVGVSASSRSYLPGPIAAGEWMLVIGKEKITESPARYHVEIDLRTTPTLAPATERMSYAPVAALETGARWYAGDFHVHSRESGDAQPSLDLVATVARDRELDFVELSDHNTDSQIDLILDAQSRHPELLLLPGVEYTTYAGHGNGIGVTSYVSHLLGVDGLTVEDAIDRIHDQGALFAINHPALDLGDSCIGCSWEHDVSADRIDAVEIETGGWTQSGHLFTAQAIVLWDTLLASGRHIAAIGGSDDHRAAMGTGTFDSPIGSPTTMVYADALNVAAILDGVRAGRTVVRLQGPGDPLLELTELTSGAMVGDTVTETHLTLRAHVVNGTGTAVRFVRNGERLDGVTVDADDFETTLEADAPYGDAADRWRAELFSGRELRVVTSHLYVTPQPGSPPPDAGVDGGTGEPMGGGGCSCRAAPGSRAPLGWLLVMVALPVLARRRG